MEMSDLWNQVQEDCRAQRSKERFENSAREGANPGNRYVSPYIFHGIIIWEASLGFFFT